MSTPSTPKWVAVIKFSLLVSFCFKHLIRLKKRFAPQYALPLLPPSHLLAISSHPFSSLLASALLIPPIPGVSRRVRRMIQTRLPDMSGFNDVGDYLLNNGEYFHVNLTAIAPATMLGFAFSIHSYSRNLTRVYFKTYPSQQAASPPSLRVKWTENTIKSICLNPCPGAETSRLSNPPFDSTNSVPDSLCSSLRFY